jgi:nucleotide-binding universal stress UspA family protein
MKKILCLIDFSNSSKNGMEYASHMAKALGSHLSLFYVRTSIWPEAVHLEQEVKESHEIISSRLSLFATEIHKEFGISCDFHIEQTTDTFEATVAARASLYDLVVMGTNGADNYYQHMYGSNSFHVIEKSKWCPILVIPENYAYRPVNLIVYAYDPETNPIFLIEQLKKLSAPLAASVKVLHISNKEPSGETTRKLEILSEAIQARAANNSLWSFDFQYSDEVSWALSQYMRDSKGDILALTSHYRSLMENLFEENTIKKISMTADYPVFVFWR